MFKFDKFRVQMRQHFMHLSIYILCKEPIDVVNVTLETTRFILCWCQNSYTRPHLIELSDGQVSVEC